MVTHCAGPHLGVGRELVGVVADVEEQALEVVELGLGELQEPGGAVGDGASRALVSRERICKTKDVRRMFQK